MKSKLQFNERGAVYILVAVSVMTFLALIAMVIDLSMATTSNEQQIHNCEYVALAAFEAFTKASPPTELEPEAAYRFRLNAALGRANEIAAKNRMVSRQFTEDDTPFDELGLDETSLDPGYVFEAGGENWGPGGLLVPGHWYTKEEANDECPGDSGNSFLCTCQGKNHRKRCFKRNVWGERSIGAFRCQARLETPIQTLAARIIGQDNIFIQGSATATSTPHSIMSLFELDESLWYETHPPGPNLRGPSEGVDTPDGPMACLSGDPGEYSLFTFGWPMEPFTAAGTRTCYANSCAGIAQWGSLPDRRPNLSPLNEAVHYKDDFALVRFYAPGNNLPTWPLCNMNTPRGSSSWAPFAASTSIDHERMEVRLNGHTSDYRGCKMIDLKVSPEPFSSLLEGLQTTMDELQRRSDGASKLGVIGFDYQVLPAAAGVRTYPYGTGFDELRSKLNPNDMRNLIQNLFIPFYGGCNATSDTSTGAGHGDYTIALRAAAKELEKADSHTTKSIILNATGISDCFTDRSGVQTCNIGRGAGGATLRATSLYLIHGLAEELIAQGIRVHVILANAREQVHTLNVPRKEYTECCDAHGEDANGLDRCPSCDGIHRWMEDDEAMDADVPFAWQGSTVAGHQNPTYCANSHPLPCYSGPSYYLYELAKRTGGRYLPLRPMPPPECCPDRNEGAICAGPNPEGGYFPRVPNTDPQDPDQRQLYDPWCRSHDQQVIDFVKELVEETDLRLVQ